MRMRAARMRAALRFLAALAAAKRRFSVLARAARILRRYALRLARAFFMAATLRRRAAAALRMAAATRALAFLDLAALRRAAMALARAMRAL